MNIFVAKLNYDTQEADLLSAFQQFGEVTECNIILDRETGRSKGFGFVEMPSDEEATAAIDGLNDQDFDGRTIVVKKAEPRENRGGGGGGFRRGGGGGGYNRDRRGGGGGGYGGGGGGGRDRRGGGGGYDRGGY